MLKEIVKELYGDIEYINHQIIENKMTLYLKSNKVIDTCPHCGKVSKSVHSYHIRKFKDLPISDNFVEVALNSKKFFCTNKDCKFTTFAENFDFIDPILKTTKRFNDKVAEIANTTSSRKAVNELLKLGIKTNRNTVWKTTNKNNITDN